MSDAVKEYGGNSQRFYLKKQVVSIVTIVLYTVNNKTQASYRPKPITKSFLE
jgi:hypothetical protein